MHHLFVIDQKAWIDDEKLMISEGVPYHQFKLSVFSEKDYVEENKKLLIDWCVHYNRFPLTAYVSAYPDMYDQIDAMLIEWDVTYEKVIMTSRKQPVYIIQLENTVQLTQVVLAFYWLPAQNEKMYLTDCMEAVMLMARKVRPKSNYTILGADIQLPEKECSVIVVQPDGQGMDIITTVEQDIQQTIPTGYVIRQWDDELLISFD